MPYATNVVDWLTKWVPLEKLEASIAYLSGSIARAAYQGSPSVPTKETAYHAMMLIAAMGNYYG